MAFWDFVGYWSGYITRDTSAATRRIDEFRLLTPWVMITIVENHTAPKRVKQRFRTSHAPRFVSKCVGPRVRFAIEDDAFSSGSA
jgi:hypothetical protein